MPLFWDLAGRVPLFRGPSLEGRVPVLGPPGRTSVSVSWISWQDGCLSFGDLLKGRVPVSVTSWKEGYLCFWDLMKGRVPLFLGHPGSTGAAVSGTSWKDGCLFLGPSKRTGACFWDSLEGREPLFLGPPGRMGACFWDLQEGRVPLFLGLPGRAGTSVSGTSRNGKPQCFWDLLKGRVPLFLGPPGKTGTSVSLVPPGCRPRNGHGSRTDSKADSGHLDGCLIFWDLPEGRVPLFLFLRPGRRPWPDGQSSRSDSKADSGRLRLVCGVLCRGPLQRSRHEPRMRLCALYIIVGRPQRAHVFSGRTVSEPVR